MNNSAEVDTESEDISTCALIDVPSPPFISSPVCQDVQRQGHERANDHKEEVGKEAELARSSGSCLVAASCADCGVSVYIEEDGGGECEYDELQCYGYRPLVDAVPALETLGPEEHWEDAGDNGALARSSGKVVDIERDSLD